MDTRNPVYEELVELASQRGWVEGLARRLVGDAQGAEDLVQEAWLVAEGHHGPAPASPSAWFAGVLKRLARGRTRTEARRTWREEHAARAEALPSTLDSATALEEQGLLIQSVLALREPYRDVVLMRFFEDRPPREIAARLDAPVATIQSRLARALEMLRDDLKRKHGGDETSWLCALIPLCGEPGPAGATLYLLALMKTKLALVAALLIAICGVTYLSDSLSRPTTPEEPAGESPPSVGMVLGASVDVAPEHPSIAQEEARSERAEVAPGSVREESFLVRVIDGESGAPAPRCRLYALDPEVARGLDDSNGPMGGFFWGFEAVLAPIRSHGQAYECDDRGEVRIPSPTPGTTFAAIDGRSLGCDLGASHEDGEELLLTLWPCGEIRARVVDASGQPLAGVPLAVNVEGRSIRVSLERGVSTDADGEAILRPWLPQGEDTPEEIPDGLQVGIDAPGGHASQVLVSFDADYRAFVELIAPPSGTLEAHIALPGGGALPDGTLVLLRAQSSTYQPPIALSTHCLRSELRDGVAIFQPIALGLELELVTSLNWFLEPWIHSLAGPTQPDEVKRVEVTMDAAVASFGGQLVSADGSPLVAEAFLTSFDDGTGSARQWPARSDEEGRFEFSLVSYDGAAPSGLLTFRPQRTPYSQLSVECVVGDRPGVGPHDLGRIVFGDEPAALMAGLVLTPAGEPAEGVYVGLARMEDGRILPDGLNAPRTGPDGHFEVFGEWPGEETFLGVSCQKRWLHEPEQVFAPSASYVVQLSEAAEISGRLRLDEGVATGDLSIEVCEHDPDEDRSLMAHGWKSCGLSPDGLFSMRGLTPGPYDLVISYALSGGELVRIRGIECGANAPADSRLNPIDLRGLLRAIDVHVFAHGRGKVISDFWLVGSDGQLSDVGRGPGLVLPDDPGAVLVAIAGRYPPGCVQLDDSDTYRVDLPEPHTVTLTWDGPVPEKLEGAQFMVELLSPPSADVGPTTRARSYFDRLSPRRAMIKPGRPAPILVSAPGEYRVRWTTWIDGEGRRSVEWELDQAPRIDVPVGGITVHIEPPVAWIESL